MEIEVTTTDGSGPVIAIDFIQYYTLLYSTILSILYYTLLYSTLLYNTIQYNTIQYNTILYNTILYYTILYYTILYYTILYYTIRPSPHRNVCVTFSLLAHFGLQPKVGAADKSGRSYSKMVGACNWGFFRCLFSEGRQMVSHNLLIALIMQGTCNLLQSSSNSTHAGLWEETQK